MSNVHIVTYLNDIHIYPDEEGDAARTLHTVAIGANTDSMLSRMTVERWERVRSLLTDQLDGEIIDHRPDPLATD